MNTKLFVRGIDDDESLRALARKKVERGLRQYASRIRIATVRLVDETGPRRRGVDKICSINLTMDQGMIRVREVGRDLRVVLDIALDRVRAALGRRVSRTKRGIAEG